MTLIAAVLLAPTTGVSRSRLPNRAAERADLNVNMNIGGFTGK